MRTIGQCWRIFFSLLSPISFVLSSLTHTANEWTVEDPKVHRHVDILAVRYVYISIQGLHAAWFPAIISIHPSNHHGALLLSFPTSAHRYAGYSCYGVAGLWLVLLIFLRKRISLAINVIKEASRAVGAMKALIFYPIIQCIGLAIFLVPWIFYRLVDRWKKAKQNRWLRHDHLPTNRQNAPPSIPTVSISWVVVPLN